MNRDQKAAVIEEVAAEIGESQAVLAIDFRGISVQQSADLRARLEDAGARFRVVKNRLTLRAADQAGAEPLKALLEGPTAFAFVRGDVALAAKALAAFRRDTQRLEFKGGTMDGDALTAADIEALARLPAREQLYAQLVGVTASPLTGLVRTLQALISGLAVQLGQIHEQGLIGATAAAASGDGQDGGQTPPAAGGDGQEGGAEASPAAAEAAAGGPSPSEEAPGSPTAEAETAAQEQQSQPQAPSEGE